MKKHDEWRFQKAKKGDSEAGRNIGGWDDEPGRIHSKTDRSFLWYNEGKQLCR
jgi:hypothetical protein